MYLTWNDVRPYVQQVQNGIMAAVRLKIAEKMAQLFLYTTITRASEGTNNQNPLVDNVEGHATGGNQPGESVPAPAQCPARRIEFPGFAFVPNVKDPSLLSGVAANLFHFALASARWRPAGLKQGETCQYNLNEKQTTWKIGQRGQVDLVAAQDAQIQIKNANGTVITVSPSGQIDIDTRGASPQPDVIVNGGSLRVARDTDPVDWGSCTATAGPYNVIFQYAAPGTGVPVANTILEPTPRINGGADHFKG